MKKYKLIKIVHLFLNNITIKINLYKLKSFIDFQFKLIEKIIVKLDKFIPFYLNFYEKIIENEIKMLNITKDKKILHIGCGSIPATSILITKKTGSNVVTIDNDIESVKFAKLCIKKLNLLNKIKIKYSDVIDFSIKDFDIIILSQGVTPYDKILKHISKSITKNTKVVLRLDYKTNINLNNYFNINKSVCSSVFGKLNSYYLSINK